MGIMDLFLEILGALALVVIVAVTGDRIGASAMVSNLITKTGPPNKSGVAS